MQDNGNVRAENPEDSRQEKIHKKVKLSGRSKDGGGIGRGDHFLPYKFIETTFEC